MSYPPPNSTPHPNHLQTLHLTLPTSKYYSTYAPSSTTSHLPHLQPPLLPLPPTNHFASPYPPPTNPHPPTLNHCSAPHPPLTSPPFSDRSSSPHPPQNAIIILPNCCSASNPSQMASSHPCHFRTFPHSKPIPNLRSIFSRQDAIARMKEECEQARARVAELTERKARIEIQYEEQVTRPLTRITSPSLRFACDRASCLCPKS